MKILFVTDRNLTHDTRVFQQLHFATSMLYKSDLIAFYSPWAREIEQRHIKLVQPRRYFYLSRYNVLSSFTRDFTNLIYPLFKNNLKIAGFSLDAKSYAIWHKIRKIAGEYDLLIAHGLPALIPVYFAHRKFKVPFGFDAASFVPEKHINMDEEEFIKIRFLLKRILPSASYFTYATDLVGRKIIDFVGLKRLPYHFSLSNAYDESFFSFRPSFSDKVEFVWLAQKVDFSADLEFILPSLEKFRNKIHLNIFGEVTQRFKEKVYPRYKDFIVLHPPTSVDLLIKSIANFDVGLAIYLSYISPEKNYTITNKVFLFAQSGLFALATDTVSHRIFYSDHPSLGKIVLPNIDSLSEAVAEVIENIDLIRSEKHKRYLYSKRFAWKYESQKLLKAWNFLKK